MFAKLSFATISTKTKNSDYEYLKTWDIEENSVFPYFFFEMKSREIRKNKTCRLNTEVNFDEQNFEFQFMLLQTRIVTSKHGT